MAPSGLREPTLEDPESWEVSMSGVNGMTGIICTHVVCAIGAVTSGMLIALA